jgi:hypothetical protein
VVLQIFHFTTGWKLSWSLGHCWVVLPFSMKELVGTCVGYFEFPRCFGGRGAAHNSLFIVSEQQEMPLRHISQHICIVQFGNYM